MAKKQAVDGRRRQCVLGVLSLSDVEEVHHLTDCRLSVGVSVTDEKSLLCETQRNFMFDEAQGGCIWGEEFDAEIDEEEVEDLMLYVFYHPEPSRSPTTYHKEGGVLGEVGLPILQITEEDQELMSPIFHSSGKEMAHLTIKVRWKSTSEIAALSEADNQAVETERPPQTPPRSASKRQKDKVPPGAVSTPAVGPPGAKPRDITLRFRSKNHPFVWDPALDEDEQWAAVCRALGLEERTKLILKERAGSKGVSWRQLVSKGGPKSISGILMVEIRKTRPVVTTAAGSPKDELPAHSIDSSRTPPRTSSATSLPPSPPEINYRACGLATHLVLKKWVHRWTAMAFRVWRDEAILEGLCLQRGQLHQRLTKLKKKMKESLMEMRETEGLEANQPDHYTTSSYGGNSPRMDASTRKGFSMGEDADVLPKSHDDLNSLIAALFVEYMQVECAWAGEREVMVHKIDQLQETVAAHASMVPKPLPPSVPEKLQDGPDKDLADNLKELSVSTTEAGQERPQTPPNDQPEEYKEYETPSKQRGKVPSIEAIEDQKLIDPKDEITILFLQKHAQFYPGGKNALFQEGHSMTNGSMGTPDKRIKIKTNFNISPTRTFERDQDPTTAANVNRQGELTVPYLRNENSAEYQYSMGDQEMALYLWALFRNFMDPIVYKPGGHVGNKTKSSSAMMKMNMVNFRRFSQHCGVMAKSSSTTTPSKRMETPAATVPPTPVKLKCADVDLIFANSISGATATISHFGKKKAAAKSLLGNSTANDSSGGPHRVPERKGLRTDKVLEFPDFVVATYQLAQRAYPSIGLHALRALVYYQLGPLIKIIAPQLLALEEEGAKETLKLMEQDAVKTLEANQLILSSLYSYYAADMAGSLVEMSNHTPGAPSWLQAPKKKSHKRSMSLEQAVVLCRDFGLSPQFVSMQDLTEAWKSSLNHCVDEMTVAPSTAYNRLSYAGFLDFLGRLALRCLDEFCEPDTPTQKRFLILFDIMNVAGGREKLLMDERARISRRAMQKGFLLV